MQSTLYYIISYIMSYIVYRISCRISYIVYRVVSYRIIYHIIYIIYHIISLSYHILSYHMVWYHIISYIILYYIHSMPHICFSHSFGHSQVGAVRRMYYKNFLTDAQMSATKFWNVCCTVYFFQKRGNNVRNVLAVCLWARSQNCDQQHLASSYLSVLSAWNNSAPTGKTFVKFDIEHFSKICRES